MKKFKRTYYIILVILVFLVSFLTFTYAFFSSKNDYNGKFNIVVGTLEYKFESNDLINNKITVNAKTEVLVYTNVTSLNDVDSKYLLYYVTSGDVEVGYDLEYGEEPNGTISANETKNIGIRIINSTENDVLVEFGVQSGLVNNELVLEKGVSIDKQLSETVLAKANNAIDKIEAYYESIKDTNTETLVTLSLPESNSLLGIDDDTLVGSAYIKNDGRIAYQVENNSSCIVKRYNNDTVEVFNNVNGICDKPIYRNLVVNGYGEYQNNTNFSSFTYNSEDNSFSYTGNSRLEFTSNFFVPIDKSKTYFESIDVKTDNSYNVIYAGLGDYDYDKNWIKPDHTYVYTDTLTTLAQDLNPGDTVVYFTDLSNWRNNTAETFQRGLIFWGYQDGSGYIWPENTYSRWAYDYQFENVGMNKENNTITLRSAWTGGSFKAGSKVSQKSATWGYNYGLFAAKKISTEYTNYTNTINGYGTSYTTFRYGSNYIKFMILIQAGETDTTYIKNIVFEEAE